jgi:hypothetical protein
MIGFEVELDRRVADASGGMIAGDRDLATCASGAFRVVTDKRGAPRVDKPKKETDYSNIELVTAPFDQSAGPDPLMAAVKSMQLFTAACYKITKRTTLADVLVACGLQYDLTADGASAGVHPATDLIHESGRQYRVEDEGADSLFVHYTVGFPAGLLYDAVDWVTARTRKDAEDADAVRYPITNALRGLRAGQAAARLFGLWAQAQYLAVPEADARALAGFVALVYTQVAACIDHADPESAGQVKNKTVAVSRVPLRVVAQALPGTVQSFLQQQAWVDMLTDYEVGTSGSDLTDFIAEQAGAAQEAVDDRSEGEDAPADILKLQGKITQVQKRLVTIYSQLAKATAKSRVKDLQQRRLKALRSLGTWQADLEKQKDILADYQGAVQARDAWDQLVTTIPADLANLNAARIGGRFPWSVINQAIVPALEGRALADNLATAAPDTLFKPGTADSSAAAPDGGLSRELATELTSDLGGREITVGEYLRSALLTPCQRPIWQGMIFGGMHELKGPDIFQVPDGKTCALIPLELRSLGASEITWDQLIAALNEIAGASLKLMQAALA